ncbi:MAG: hypothetical protein LH631_13355 [Alkalinema sp. CAN_BIN05]|nr:hypothetical protein [Alkalinema sp. CAN_BIN05]
MNSTPLIDCDPDPILDCLHLHQNALNLVTETLLGLKMLPENPIVCSDGDPISQSWLLLKTMVDDRIIPSLMQLLNTFELNNGIQDDKTNVLKTSVLKNQLRSLTPEVTRLTKLLQLDRQFWQAARQSDRILQRQQQFTQHLTQLAQLLEAIVHHLNIYHLNSVD